METLSGGRPPCRRRALWIAVGLAILLSLPALRVGLVADDFFHRAALLGSEKFAQFVSSPNDMFSFFDGDPTRVQQMMDAGFLPWWVYPGMKAAFWRPLTVLTHQLDYRLWPDHPWLMHAQNIAWYAAVVAAVALIYRRFIPTGWVVGLAAVLYAVDDAHAMPIAFIANRNALIATFLGVLALGLHDRWRRGGWRFGAVLAPGILLLSLLAKEEGVATCAYLAAYALFVDRGPLLRRAATLVPYAVVVIAWRGLWSYLGYGVANVGFYVDPLNEPARYLAALVQRAPYLLLGQWAGLPAELYLMENLVGAALVRSLWWVGVAAAVLLALVLWPMIRRDATARFWALGALLALLPACTTFPADRMLLFVGVGAFGLIAQFLAATFAPRASQPREGSVGPASPTSQASSVRLPALPAGGRRSKFASPAALVGGLLILVHIVVAPIGLPLRVGMPTGPRLVEQFAMRAPLDATVAQQDLIVVNPPSLLHVGYLPVEREFAGLPAPRRVRYLGSGLAAMTVRRPDAQTLVVGIDGGYIGWTFERLFRDERQRMALGEQVVLTGMTATVTDLTPDGRPAEAAFRFGVALEDLSLRWLVWRNGEFVPFTPPAVGGEIELPSTQFSLWG